MKDSPDDLPSRAACCLLAAAQAIGPEIGLAPYVHVYETWGDRLPNCQHSFISAEIVAPRIAYDRDRCHTMTFWRWKIRCGRTAAPEVSPDLAGTCDIHGHLGQCPDCGESPPIYPDDPNSCDVAAGHTVTSHAWTRAREFTRAQRDIGDKFCECFVACAGAHHVCSEPNVYRAEPWHSGCWSGYQIWVEMAIL